MGEPCDKGPAIELLRGTTERIADQLEAHGSKLDKIHDHLTILAVQKERIDGLAHQVTDHEGRIRGIESAPSKRLEKAAWLLLGGIGAVILTLLSKVL